MTAVGKWKSKNRIPTFPQRLPGLYQIIKKRKEINPKPRTSSFRLISGLENALGQSLLAANPKGIRGHILISHTHWDHIQGLPFFAPLFVPGNEWDIYGPVGLDESMREALSGQMQYTYFPVTMEQFGATVRYHDLVEGDFRIDDVRIATHYLNHPALTLGYRLEADGATVVYSCDHEPYSRTLAGGTGEITGHDERHAAFLRGADLVIHDAQYTAREYPAKIGWGHSPVEYAVQMARYAVTQGQTQVVCPACPMNSSWVTGLK